MQKRLMVNSMKPINAKIAGDQKLVDIEGEGLVNTGGLPPFPSGQIAFGATPLDTGEAEEVFNNSPIDGELAAVPSSSVIFDELESPTSYIEADIMPVIDSFDDSIDESGAPLHGTICNEVLDDSETGDLDDLSSSSPIEGTLQGQKQGTSSTVSKPVKASSLKSDGKTISTYLAQLQSITGTKAIDVPMISIHLRRKERIVFVLGADEECLAYNESDGAYHMLSKTSFNRFVIRSLREEGIGGLDLIDPNTLQTVFKNLRNDPPLLLEADELSPNDHLVNFRNGFVDLDDELLHVYPHSPDLMMTSCLQAKFVPNAHPKRFLEYLEFQWPDLTERERALDIMSLCISSLKRLKLILFFVGKKDCGKSQIIETLTKIVGDEFATPFKLGDFAGKFYVGEMRGKRLMYCADVDTTTPLKNVDVIKTATGRDTIIAEPKNKSRSNFRAVSIFLFAGNDTPNLGKHSSDMALIDRFALLHFPNPVPPENQVDGFGELLFREEGDEIASYLISHLHRLAKRDFHITPSVSADESMEALRRGDPLSALNEYIDTKLVLAPGQVVSCQEAYTRYAEWVQSKERPVVLYAQFRNQVMSRLPAVIDKARPHHTRDENNVACFIGVAYADNEE